MRRAGGSTWNDRSLDDWPDDDYRIFVGDLGNEVNDKVLGAAFAEFESFNKARVIRDKKTGKSRGYGFVSFLNPHDMLKALKEKHRSHVGNRMISVMRSRWKDREIDSSRNKKLNEAIQAVGTAEVGKPRTLKKFKAIKSSDGGLHKQNIILKKETNEKKQRRVFGQPARFGSFMDKGIQNYLKSKQNTE